MKRHQEVLNKLFKLLDSVRKQPSELYEHLSEIMVPQFYPNREILFKEGQVINKAIYLSDGYIMGYCINTDNEKQVVHLYGPNEIIAGVSFMEQIPSVYNLEVLPGSYLLTLTFEQMQEVYKLFPSTEELARLIVASREKLQVEFHRLLSEHATVRLTHFYRRFPELLARPKLIVRDPEIASYLGLVGRTVRNSRKRMKNCGTY
jgi:CRP-like cAMP-binding protein